MQYSNHGRDRVTAEGTHPGSSIPAGKLGVCYKPSKSELVPTQEIEFLGFKINSTKMEIKLPGEKLRKIKSETGKILQDRSVVSSHIVPHNRENECSHTSHSHGSTLLQELAGMSLRGLAGESELLLNSGTDQRGQRRAGVVARLLHPMEWSKPH